MLVEACDAAHEEALFKLLGLDADDGDGAPGDGHVNGLLRALVQDGQDHAGALRPANLLDGVVQAQLHGRLAVDLHDDVAGLQAGLVSRGVFNGRDHDEPPVLGADLDADAVEGPAGRVLQLLEIVGGEEGRVRVKLFEHALDGVLDQLGLGDLLDIVGLHHVHNLAEPAQGFELVILSRCGPKRSRGDGQGQEHDKTNKPDASAHSSSVKPKTPIGFGAYWAGMSHSRGLIGFWWKRNSKYTPLPCASG